MAVSTLPSLDSLLKHQEILYLQQSIQSEQQWSCIWPLGVDRGVPEVWGSVYDVRDLLDASVKLMDGKSPLEIELPGVLDNIKKPLLRKIKGTVIEKVLKDHNVIKDYMKY